MQIFFDKFGRGMNENVLKFTHMFQIFANKIQIYIQNLKRNTLRQFLFGCVLETTQ